MEPLIQALRSRDPKVLDAILTSVTLRSKEVALTLNGDTLAKALGIAIGDVAPDVLTLVSPATLRRRGVEAKLFLGEPRPSPDAVLLRALREAHRWTAQIRDGVPIAVIAKKAGHHDPLIRTRAQLAFLSPKIQAAIRDGTLPSELTSKRLLRKQPPLNWQVQEKIFGV